MSIKDLFDDPLNFVDVTKASDIIHEESYITACEVVGPNSLEFAKSRERIIDTYTNDFYTMLALKLLEKGSLVKQYGPKIRVTVNYRTEIELGGAWQTNFSSDKLAECISRARALRRAAIEFELKELIDGKAGRDK